MAKLSLARPLAWSIAALSLALTLSGLAVSWRAGPLWLDTTLLFGPVTVITYALVGALVASRQPRNPIGWIFTLEGVLYGLVILSSNYRMTGQSGAANLLGIKILQWLGLWLWIPTTVLPLTFLLLLFPDGHLPSARWRPIAWSAGLALALYSASTALDPRPTDDPTPLLNPFGIPGAAVVLDMLGYVIVPLLLVGIFGTLAALVVRFQRSRGIEREQLKWLAYGGMLAILGISMMSILSIFRPDDPLVSAWTLTSVWVGLTMIAIAAGIAILRHRLYDIDIIINRTLVYGTLSAGVVGLYVLLVAAFGALFESSGNLLITLLATGLAALLIQPLRARLQRGVNRLMYGERDDPYAVLSRLSQQLKTTLAPSAVLPTIAEAVAQTLKLPYVALALMHGNRLEIAAAYGRPAGDPMQLPLIYQAETVGQLLVAPRAPGETFTRAERRLLEDIALQAGVAAHAVRLTADLQRSRERLITAREEERRRLRRDLHDGLGPQLASLTLTLAAARELLRHDVDAADRLLQELAIHAQSAITDIRRVVYALRPPALDDLGLVLALREQAAQYCQIGLQITINAPEHLPPLPAAVEVAAYRIVQEALTNVLRYGKGLSRVDAVVEHTPGVVHIRVQNDGVGSAYAAGAASALGSGQGIPGMRARAGMYGGTVQASALPAGGWLVTAELHYDKGVAGDA